MSFFKKFFKKDDKSGEQERNDDIDTSNAPPESESKVVSIYEHIKNNLDSEGRITSAGTELPDDEQFYASFSRKFIPGFFEGIYLETDEGENRKAVDELIRLMKSANDSLTPETANNLYSAIKNVNKDRIFLAISKLAEENFVVSHELITWFKDILFASPYRNVVKFIIIYLGCLEYKALRDAFILLGKHEEFTYYSSIALGAVSPEPADDIFELAKATSGWGRIACIKELKSFEPEPKIQKWVLREGYNNDIGIDYLAYHCADYGNLKKALEAEVIDKELFECAGELIEAMIESNQIGIETYKDTPAVLESYLKHFKRHGASLEDFLVLKKISNFIEEPFDFIESDIEWHIDDVKALHPEYEEICSLELWERLLDDALDGDGGTEDYVIAGAAKLLNINIWDYYKEKIKEDPLNTSYWWHIMENAEEDNINEICSYAEDLLPLDEIATGPEDVSGAVNLESPHMCLTFIVQELKHYPAGTGKNLVLTALRNPEIGLRNQAVRVLHNWFHITKEPWITETLEEHRKIEPSESVQGNIEVFLSGKPPEDYYE